MQELIKAFTAVGNWEDFVSLFNKLPPILESLHCPPLLMAVLTILLPLLYAAFGLSVIGIAIYLIYSAFRAFFNRRGKF